MDKIEPGRHDPLQANHLRPRACLDRDWSTSYGAKHPARLNEAAVKMLAQKWERGSSGQLNGSCQQCAKAVRSHIKQTKLPPKMKVPKRATI